MGLLISQKIWRDFSIMKNHYEQFLKKIYQKTELFLKENYNRSLPFQDGFFDRFERAKRLGFGNKTSIYNSAHVFGNVKVGKNTWIGPYVMLDGSGGTIDIGDFCSISAGCHIYTHDSVLWSLSGGNSKASTAPVKIGSNVYIGAQSVIKHGVVIGSRCVIGANSFINSDVPDNTIFVGSPAKKIGTVSVHEDTQKVKLNYDRR